jgi:hypothetical protein
MMPAPQRFGIRAPARAPARTAPALAAVRVPAPVARTGAVGVAQKFVATVAAQKPAPAPFARNSIFGPLVQKVIQKASAANPAGGSSPPPATRTPIAGGISAPASVRGTLLGSSSPGEVISQPYGAPPSGAPSSLSLFPGVSYASTVPDSAGMIPIAGFEFSSSMLIFGGLALIVFFAVRK